MEQLNYYNYNLNENLNKVTNKRPFPEDTHHTTTFPESIPYNKLIKYGVLRTIRYNSIWDMTSDMQVELFHVNPLWKSEIRNQKLIGL